MYAVGRGGASPFAGSPMKIVKNQCDMHSLATWHRRCLYRAMDTKNFTTDDYEADDDRGMSWGWFAVCVLVLYLMWVA